MTWPLFLELLIKSGLIAAAGVGLSALLVHRPAAERALMLRITVCLLLALPVFMWIGPRLSLGWLASTTAESVTPLPAAAQWSVNLHPVADASITGAVPTRFPWALVMALAYSTGLLVISGRFFLGLWTLGRWTNEGRVVVDPAWANALLRLDPSGLTRLIVSNRVKGPLSWGLPPGIILIGEDCLKQRHAASAVLAHELAHIHRGDWIFALLSKLALALFWFNPMVWLLHAALSARIEEAADAQAVRAIEPRTYARALIDLACDHTCPAALGMIGSPDALKKRIAQVMKPQPKISRPLVMLLSIGTLVALATPLAAVELTARQGSTAMVAEDRTLPAPPAPPAPPAAPSSMAPPAPPASSFGSEPRRYVSLRVPDGSAVRISQRVSQNATSARAEAVSARTEANLARDESLRARDEASRAADASRRDAAVIADRDQAIAATAQAQARVARRESQVAMRHSADEMDRSATALRTNSQRLRDPAYRAEVIAENRADGNEVTDAELIALSRSLPRQAAEMNRQAQSLREQAARDL